MVKLALTIYRTYKSPLESLFSEEIQKEEKAFSNNG